MIRVKLTLLTQQTLLHIGAHLQHHQAGEGGHQNPQGRLLLSSTHSRQGCGLGGHGQKSIH